MSIFLILTSTRTAETYEYIDNCDEAHSEFLISIFNNRAIYTKQNKSRLT